MHVINCADIGGVLIPKPYERLVKVIMAPDTQEDVKDISITMGIIAPNSRNDLHVHENGVEVLYIVTGYGKAVVGDTIYDLKANHLIIAPKGVPHQQINESAETMRMLAIWTPAVSGEEVVERALNAAQV